MLVRLTVPAQVLLLVLYVLHFLVFYLLFPSLSYLQFSNYFCVYLNSVTLVLFASARDVGAYRGMRSWCHRSHMASA